MVCRLPNATRNIKVERGTGGSAASGATPGKAANGGDSIAKP